MPLDSYAPNSKALNDIGPEDVWGVWFSVPEFLQNVGEPPVDFRWILASRGDKGLDEIKGPKGCSESFIAALPMSLLQQAEMVIAPDRGPSKLPRWVQAAMGIEEAFGLVKTASGTVRLLKSKEKVDPSEELLVQGSMRDFKNLLEEGCRIIDAKDWKLVHDDLRPEGKIGNVKWIQFKRNPLAAAALEEFLAADYTGL
jgi:hypothetical protein